MQFRYIAKQITKLYARHLSARMWNIEYGGPMGLSLGSRLILLVMPFSCVTTQAPSPHEDPRPTQQSVIPRCHTTANPLAGRTPTHEHLCRSGSGAIRRRHDGCLDYRTFADRLSKSYLANLGDAVQGGKAQAATANRSGTQRGCRRRGIDLAVGQSHTDRGTHGLFAYRPKSYGGNL
jgi:hypothetical protein